MAKEQNTDKKNFYKKLQEELEKNTDWPSQYMYKFIVPNEKNKDSIVLEKFSQIEKKITKNYSKTGKYVSITIVTIEESANTIINRYKSLENIEGLIAL